jgi:alkaline phosphatase D
VWETSTDDFATVAASGTVTRAAPTAQRARRRRVGGPVGYRFRPAGFTSPVGRAPRPTSARPLRIAAASCQHFETGFYAAHRDIAEWAPDAVVFLGDFIYEGPAQPVGDGVLRSTTGRADRPRGYRARYAQYLGDPTCRRAGRRARGG